MRMTKVVPTLTPHGLVSSKGSSIQHGRSVFASTILNIYLIYRLRGPLTTTMDLRISADADIKRLREMVQKLEEKNAGLKAHDGSRLGREANTGTTRYISDKMSTNASPVLSKVAVKLHLDDVPLMNLSDVDSEEEDSW